MLLSPSRGPQAAVGPTEASKSPYSVEGLWAEECAFLTGTGPGTTLGEPLLHAKLAHMEVSSQNSQT